MLNTSVKKSEEACHEIIAAQKPRSSRNAFVQESRNKKLSGKGGGVYGISKTEA